MFSRLRSQPLPSRAKEIDCDSWAQVYSKFVISHPAITCAIPATSNLAHLKDNMKAAFERFALKRNCGTRIATELSQ